MIYHIELLRELVLGATAFVLRRPSLFFCKERSHVGSVNSVGRVGSVSGRVSVCQTVSGPSLWLGQLRGCRVRIFSCDPSCMNDMGIGRGGHIPNFHNKNITHRITHSYHGNMFGQMFVSSFVCM